MAKVRESLKKNASTTKLKTEPAKSNPGKVRKLRINVKRVKKINEPKIRKSSKNTSEVSPELKLCVVKLRRTRINNSYVKESRNSNDNNNKTDNNSTLLAQCKSVGGKISHNSIKGANGISERKLSSKSMRRKASKESTKIRTRRIRESKASNSFESILERNILKEENVHKSSRSRKIKPSTRVASVKEIEGNKAPTTTGCTKRCAVRLQRTPITSEVKEPNKKNCKVRLRKISTQQRVDQAIGKWHSFKSFSCKSF